MKVQIDIALGELADDLGARVLVHVQNDDSIVVFGEPLDDGLANVSRTSGDDSDFVHGDSFYLIS